MKKPRSRTVDIAALGEFIYGEDWRAALADMTNWNMLIELAAAKQFREVIKKLEYVRRNEGGLPEIIELSITSPNTKVHSIYCRTWSEQTDRDVKTRCMVMLKDNFEGYGVTVEIKDGND